MPQLEDGYTRIANELLEALCKIRVPGEPMQIFLMILRKTYGFGKKMDKISLSQFVESSGMKKPHVVRAIRHLQSLNIIIKEDNGLAVSYGINKNYLNWQPLPKKVMFATRKPILKQFCYVCNFGDAFEDHHIVPRAKGGSNKFTNRINLCPNCHTLTHKGKYSEAEMFTIKDKVENGIKDDNGLLPLGEKTRPKKIPTKEKVKERKKGELLKICSTWKDYLDMRKKIGHPLTDKAMTLAVNKLHVLLKAGHDPIIVMEQSIFHSWQGLFEVKSEKSTAIITPIQNAMGTPEQLAMVQRLKERQNATA